MSGDPLAPKPGRGLLAWLFGRQSMRRTVRRSERLDFIVPAAEAERVRTAIEQWLASRGVTARLETEDAADDKTRIRARLDEADAAKVDLSAEDVLAELEDVIEKAVE